MQQRIISTNLGRQADAAIQLRIGIHVSEVVVDELDVYCAGVNLAARLASLAQPGEVVVSAQVRDQIVPGVHASVEDMGECYLKHIARPERAFKISPTGALHGSVMAGNVGESMLPSIAVIPMLAPAGDPEASLYGELIADGVIARLSRNAGLRVISRLSTTVLKAHADLGNIVRQHLRATFVLSGSCMVQGSRLLLVVELAETRTGSVIWAEQIVTEKNALISDQGSVTEEIAQAASLAIVQAEVIRIRTMPFPSLESFSLLIGSISLLHRASTKDFQLAHDALEALIERAPRHGSAHTWKAKWHFLRLIRGLSPSADDDVLHARFASEQTIPGTEQTRAWTGTRVRATIHAHIASTR